jgi:hypothetical protein
MALPDGAFTSSTLTVTVMDGAQLCTFSSSSSAGFHISANEAVVLCVLNSNGRQLVWLAVAQSRLSSGVPSVEFVVWGSDSMVYLTNLEGTHTSISTTPKFMNATVPNGDGWKDPVWLINLSNLKSNNKVHLTILAVLCLDQSCLSLPLPLSSHY